MARAVSWMALDAPKEASSPLVWLVHYAGWILGALVHDHPAVRAVGEPCPQRRREPLHAAAARAGVRAAAGGYRVGRFLPQHRAHAVAGARGLCDCRGPGRPARHADGAQRLCALVLRAGHLGGLSHAKGRLPADLHSLVRRLRHVEDRDDRGGRDLSGDHRHHRRPARSGAGADLVGPQHGGTRREILWQIMVPAALPQILTGLQVALPMAIIIAIATEMLMGGTGLGGAMLEASRMADFARRLRRPDRDDRDRLCGDQGHVGGAAPPAAVAPGNPAAGRPLARPVRRVRNHELHRPVDSAARRRAAGDRSRRLCGRSCAARARPISRWCARPMPMRASSSSIPRPRGRSPARSWCAPAKTTRRRISACRCR